LVSGKTAFFGDSHDFAGVSQDALGDLQMNLGVKTQLSSIAP